MRRKPPSFVANLPLNSSQRPYDPDLPLAKFLSSLAWRLKSFPSFPLILSDLHITLHRPNFNAYTYRADIIASFVSPPSAIEDNRFF